MPDQIQRHILHLPKGKRHKVPRFDPNRLSGRRLQVRNARILQRDPLCKICLAQTPSIVSQSVEVDHRVPLHLGGSDTDDNLQGICLECHKAKTGKEATARANGTAVVLAPKPREYNIA